MFVDVRSDPTSFLPPYATARGQQCVSSSKFRAFGNKLCLRASRVFTARVKTDYDDDGDDDANAAGSPLCPDDSFT